MRKILPTALLGAATFGFVALATPEPAFAGKGGKGGPPPPPPCGCAEVIVIGDLVCVLEDCGFDCVYACTGI